MLTPIEDYFTSMKAPAVNTEEEYAWFSGLNHPIYNPVIHFKPNGNIEERVDALVAKAPMGIPISFWIDPTEDSELVEVLKRKNFKMAESIPFMTWEVQPIDRPQARIEKVTQDTIDLFFQIIGVVAEYDEKLLKGLQDLIVQSPAELYLVYSNDVAVGTATLFFKGNVGCVFNVTILPKYQKQRLGTALMRALMCRAHELGLKTLILHSSPIAYKMYTSLGFVKKSQLEIYIK